MEFDPFLDNDHEPDTKNEINEDELTISEDELCPACGEYTLEMRFRGHTLVSEYCKRCTYGSD